MSGVLSDKFDFPPLSILDATSKRWQLRKQEWLARGISSEIGRDQNLLRLSDTIRKGGNGTSVFDPVLAELAYKWFAKPKGQVIDPFAGGSVRGVVAGWRGLLYWGCDLSERQIEENRKQAEEIRRNHPHEFREMPIWVVGDSIDKLDGAPDADFLFSCPPYGHLEVYSDDARDLSNMDAEKFLLAYRAIIVKSVSKLRDNSFACFVVGDYRDKHGYLSNLYGETVHAFKKAGAHFYNNMILRTPIGSAAIRAAGAFTNKKATTVHQHVLVFCKGDPQKVTEKNTTLTVVEQA